ncbi:MAG TPA: DNA repair protein RecN [Gemmatimonadales bacterium]|nr:DNA repair protein RecN [Gemmatimonadales bacterium]
MIVELRVRDLATIADVTLPLGPGLNVLTGETGAGKSMLVDAIGLLLGGRADSGAIRPGKARAVVEGVFEEIPASLRSSIDALGLPQEEGRLVIRREITAEGRSRAWINDSPTTMTVLSDLGAHLVELHGQHETQSLLRADTQRDLLDAFGEAESDRRALAEAVSAQQAIAEEQKSLAARRGEVRKRADYLRHVVREIDAARLVAGEEEALDQESRRLGQVEQLTLLAARIAGALEGDRGSALEALGEASRALTQLEKTDSATAEWRELLDAASANLGELARAAREYGAGLEADPGRLAELEVRRDLLYRLKQKYGETLSAVLDTRRESAAELDLLDTADLDLKTLGARRAAQDAAVRVAAQGLTEKRTAAAESLARAVNRLLPKLGFSGGKVSVALVPLSQPTTTGYESVQFLVQLNTGMEERPLARVASGGELSRLTLALEVVLARHDAVPTLVFDEVDQGIGGEVGRQVAEALAEVGKRHQVLVITHLPQIAARADRHLVVSKRAKGGLATSDVAWIHGEDRVGELARMLGDPDAETARRHALAMLNPGER